MMKVKNFNVWTLFKGVLQYERLKRGGGGRKVRRILHKSKPLHHELKKHLVYMNVLREAKKLKAKGIVCKIQKMCHLPS